MTQETHETAMLARAIREARPLASLAGVPASSLEAARSLARWAEHAEEPGLALAAWEGCAALDDSCESWLGLAELAVSLGESTRAWEAAGRVVGHRLSSPAERDRAYLILARVCLLLRRPDEARKHLANIAADADETVARTANAIAARLG